ncbi:dynactin subunit 3 [Augochlora pura]
MTTIELLESRIAELEKCVFGLKEASGNNGTPPENPVIHSLLDVNTLVSSAMSGRKHANMLIQRLPELNRYLDPVADSTELPIEAKLQLLLTMAPEIKQNCDMLHQMQELMPVLETDKIRDVPELSKKLNDLNLSYLKIHENNQDLNSHINEVFSKYNEVITSITKSFITIDAAVTAAELSMVKKKVDKEN